MPSAKKQFHPTAGIFPLMDGAPFDELVADIKQRGLMEPITLHEERILDGRNRYRACVKARVEPRFRKYGGRDPLGFVISLNLKRRHLNESQRADIAARLETMPRGRPKIKDAIVHVSRSEAAKMLNVSERSVASAAAVRKQGTPELIAAVEQGHLDVSTASRSAKLPAADQREIAKKAAAGEINPARKVAKQKIRAQHERELGEKQTALPDKRYGVILADPEWKFEVWSALGQVNAAAENHYRTSVLDVIKQRSVPGIAAKDCVLFLWSTVPMLPQALEVMAAWGFRYVTNFAWIKDRAGTGYWNRNKHETLLVGVKGKVPAPAPGKQWESAFEARKGRHSAKPERSLELIEDYFPTLPKIELNRRGPARPGWDAWGDEAE